MRFELATAPEGLSGECLTGGLRRGKKLRLFAGVRVSFSARNWMLKSIHFFCVAKRKTFFTISISNTSMPQGDDTESSLVRYSALLRESWLSFQVCNNAQRIYDIWSSPHRTCNAQVVQVNSREEFGILHIEYSHRVSRGTTIQSYAAPSSSPILFVSYLA